MLIDSTNSEALEESSNGPLKGLIPKTDSIVFESVTDFNKDPLSGKQTTTTTSGKPFSIGNVPLLLEKRKDGIIADNMDDKYTGLDKWRIGKMIGGGGTSRVYRALNIQTGCLYAVKKVHLCEFDEEECKT